MCTTLIWMTRLSCLLWIAFVVVETGAQDFRTTITSAVAQIRRLQTPDAALSKWGKPDDPFFDGTVFEYRHKLGLRDIRLDYVRTAGHSSPQLGRIYIGYIPAPKEADLLAWLGAPRQRDRREPPNSPVGLRLVYEGQDKAGLGVISLVLFDRPPYPIQQPWMNMMLFGDPRRP